MIRAGIASLSLRESSLFARAPPSDQLGVTKSRATSKGRKKTEIRVVSGEKNFNTLQRDRSFVVAENSRVIKPKC